MLLFKTYLIIRHRKKIRKQFKNNKLRIIAPTWNDEFELQKQPPRGVLRKRCSENIQEIYRRTPVQKCDFKKVAKQLH